jgi:hypothetical protein
MEKPVVAHRVTGCGPAPSPPTSRIPQPAPLPQTWQNSRCFGGRTKPRYVSEPPVSCLIDQLAGAAAIKRR